MTNKIGLRTAEEFMSDFTPTYKALFALFLSVVVSYSEEVGKVSFKRAEAVGDIRMKHVVPKDTHIHQIAALEKEKIFKKYFFGAQFVQSTLQDRKGIEDIVAQVLEENLKLADTLLLLGEGTSASDVVNNGLYWSADPNYTLESSAEVQNDNAWLTDLHAKVVTTKIKADLVSGRKVIIFYGADLMPKLNGIYASSASPFKVSLQAVLGGDYSIAEMPADVTPSGANGWIIVNMDKVKLHMMTLPKLAGQGINEEQMHSWHNFLGGSMMLDVLAKNAVIRQPVTFEAAA